jgi:4-hydroxy-tetrahydrodipicolinate synthase
MTTGQLYGVIPPVITPVDDEDRVDENAFRGQIRRLIVAGVHGLFVGGSAGEGPLLTDREWERMAAIAAGEVGEQVFLLGGVMDTSTQRVLAKVRTLRELGYRHCVVTPTYYLALRCGDEVLRLFDACVNHAGPMNVVAYNIPQCVGYAMPADVMFEMARRGWVRTVKESSGNLDYTLRLIREGADVGLAVLQGDEGQMAASLAAGAVGIVPGSANVEPETFVALYRATQAGDAAEMAQRAARIAELRQALPLVGEQWLAGIKYAAARIGFGSGRPVSPLQPLSAVQAAAVDEFLARSLARKLTYQKP